MADPTPTDYRALCARMADELDHYRQLLMDDRRETHALAAEARAALAQPEPQGPTDEELMALAVAVFEDPFSTDKDYARAVLARWGRPAIEPVPVAERLPGPEACDGEGRCYAWDGYWWLVRSAVLEEDDTGAGEGYTHWLPHHALPVPQQQQEAE